MKRIWFLCLSFGLSLLLTGCWLKTGNPSQEPQPEIVKQELPDQEGSPLLLSSTSLGNYEEILQEVINSEAPCSVCEIKSTPEDIKTLIMQAKQKEQNLPHPETASAGTYSEFDFLKAYDTVYNGDTYRIIPAATGKNLLTVTLNDQPVFSFERTFITKEPVKNFFVNEAWWWLLYDENSYYDESNPQDKQEMMAKQGKPWRETNVLVHNGEKQTQNADNFALYNFNGKTFYFLRKQAWDKLSYFYDGKVYQTDFDEIIEDTMGSDIENAFEPIVDEEKGFLLFWAKKGEELSVNLLKTKTLAKIP